MSRLPTILAVSVPLVLLAALVPDGAKRTLTPLLVPVFGLALVVAFIYFGADVVGKSVNAGRRKAPPRPQPPPRAFPVVPIADGPGRFRVGGVDRESKLDTVWFCQAESAANARVKAELEGIIPTRVERVAGV